jgi:hypothetical protein
MTALWQILVAMGGPFVPLTPVAFDDSSPDSGRSDAR